MPNPDDSQRGPKNLFDAFSDAAVAGKLGIDPTDLSLLPEKPEWHT